MNKFYTQQINGSNFELINTNETVVETNLNFKAINHSTKYNAIF